MLWIICHNNKIKKSYNYWNASSASLLSRCWLMVYVTIRGQQPRTYDDKKKIIIYIKNFVMFWQAAFYNQNEVSLRAAWSILEGLVRLAGCVFDNPVFDGSAATLSCILLGPPVSSEDEGPNVMVRVHLATCSTNDRFLFFHEPVYRPGTEGKAAICCSCRLKALRQQLSEQQIPSYILQTQHGSKPTSCLVLASELFSWWPDSAK